MSIVDTITCTISNHEPTYVFTVVLNDREVDRLKHRWLLGLFEVKKSVPEFLNDLSQRLADDIEDKFIEMQVKLEKEK